MGPPPPASGGRRLSLPEVVSHCKRRGLVFTNSEIYGGMATGPDFGPYGAALKRNVSARWWRDFVDSRPDCVGLDTSLILSPRVWHASGHVAQFTDPLTECGTCRHRARADKLLSAAILLQQRQQQQQQQAGAAPAPAAQGGGVPALDRLPMSRLGEMLVELQVRCPNCGALPGPPPPPPPTATAAAAAVAGAGAAVSGGKGGLGPPRTFNLLFETHVGPVTHAAEEAASSAAAPAVSSSAAYLRPETAQGAYVQLLNVLNSTRRKLPLGVGQIGRSFRNEIAVGQFLFRTREFEQAELQYFVDPKDSAAAHGRWVGDCVRWLHSIGLSGSSVRVKEYGRSELAHYALATSDIEFHYPFGWEELWGIANRGDYDLCAHAAGSGVKMGVAGDPNDPKRVFVPHVVEPALGVNRLILALLCDGLIEEPVAAGAGAAGVVAADGSDDKGKRLTAAAGQRKADGDGESESGDSSSPSSNPSTRLVFRIHEDLAPLRFAVLPLLKREPQLSAASALFADILAAGGGPGEMDSTQAIGRRYRRQDEIGTPLCVTVDHATIADGSVTIRHRDTAAQVRMQGAEVVRLAKEGKLKPSAIAWG